MLDRNVCLIEEKVDAGIQHQGSSIQHRAARLSTRYGAAGVRLVVLFVLMTIPWISAAQEFEPRTFAVAPPGLNFVALVYGHASGAVFMDPSLPAKDVDADVHRGHEVREQL